MDLDSDIVFYKVNLVCNVVESIGCGSRSKPVLLELENETLIKEVKLNRKGDTLAILWNQIDVVSRDIIIASISSKYDIVANELPENDRNEPLKSFIRGGSNWLNAAQIDELSREEAEVVAKQLVAVYEAETVLNSNQKTRLKKDIVTVFYDFFLNFESMQQLSDTNIYRKLVIKVIETSKSYLNSNLTPEINLLLNAIGGHYENKDQTNFINNLN